MFNTGKCPNCGKVITHVILEDMSIHHNFAPKWRGVSLVCPQCNTILSVSFDPIAIKTDTVREITGR